MINIDKFKETELRVGKIISAERVLGSDKLVKLMVDLGEPENRQIIAGIGKKYAPEDLIGREIVIVANLEPRKFVIKSDSGDMTLESHGMLLAASGVDGPVLLAPSNEVQPGATVG